MDNTTQTETKRTSWITAERAAHAAEVAELEAEMAAREAQIADLVRYLNSGKFSVDPTVQVVDVLTRLGTR